MLCNNPKKYAVVEPEGRILGQKCADIVVRHVAVSPAAVQQTDKFRIHIYDEGSTEVAGKRDVLATLHPGVLANTGTIASLVRMAKIELIEWPLRVILKGDCLVIGFGVDWYYYSFCAIQLDFCRIHKLVT